MEYKLVIDQKVVDDYAEYYFKQHPRAKKKPIEKPIHPSINEWMVLKRPQMNQLKQKHKEFIVWFINRLGYANQKLDKVVMFVNIYKPT